MYVHLGRVLDSQLQASSGEYWLIDGQQRARRQSRTHVSKYTCTYSLRTCWRRLKYVHLLNPYGQVPTYTHSGVGLIRGELSRRPSCLALPQANIANIAIGPGLGRRIGPTWSFFFFFFFLSLFFFLFTLPNNTHHSLTHPQIRGPWLHVRVVRCRLPDAARLRRIRGMLHALALLRSF